MNIHMLALALAVALTVPSAWAAGQDPAAAELLFQKGREAMDSGDLETACESFAESQRLDPAAGTVLNLATCEEKLGRLASAWEHWQHALRLLDDDDRRRDFAEERVVALESELPRLSIVLKDGTQANVSVERNGVELGRASLGESLPVDPGSHRVTVRSINHAARSYQVDIQVGEQKTLEVTTGEALPESAAEGSTNKRGRTQRTWSYALAGVGVAGIGTAAVTGALLPGTQKKVTENCPARECNEAGLQAVSQGKTFLALNTIGWIVGGIGLATGATLFFTSPSQKEPQASKGQAQVELFRGGAALSYAGAF